METIGERIRKSRRELSDHGARFYTDTRSAGRELVAAVHEEARGWKSYLVDRYAALGARRGAAEQDDAAGRPIWVRLDELLSRVKGRERNAEPGHADAGPGAETSEPSVENVAASKKIEA